MSHQDRKSKECIVVNHKSLKQAIDVLLPTSVFRGIKMRRGSRWGARMLAVVALLWAWSGMPTLVGRFADAWKVTRKAFRWATTGRDVSGVHEATAEVALRIEGAGHGRTSRSDEARLVRALEDRGVRDRRGGWQPSRGLPHRVE